MPGSSHPQRFWFDWPRCSLGTRMFVSFPDDSSGHLRQSYCSKSSGNETSTAAQWFFRERLLGRGVRGLRGGMSLPGDHLFSKSGQPPVAPRKGDSSWKEKALLKQSNLLYKGDAISCALQMEHRSAAGLFWCLRSEAEVNPM